MEELRLCDFEVWDVRFWVERRRWFSGAAGATAGV